mmetsp:Transcript_85490/g.161092  ORF Transcript_85490/g.161092 Transcript_85490/m.161092 type:complete len:295 (-) Transcript_85490:46-930(-)
MMVAWPVVLALLSRTGAAGSSDRDFGTRRLRVRSASAPEPKMTKLAPAGVGEIGKQLGDISDKMAEVFEPKTVSAPRYDYTYAPPNPPHAPDISPTDPGEYFESLGGTVADIINPLQSALSDGSGFRRVTCRSACEACMIHAAEHSVGVCPCYAECKQGACGDNPHVGWSNNKVSTPLEKWDAQCNIGTKNCEEECLSADFVKEVKGCQSSKNPTECYDLLRRLHREASVDSRKDVMYCIREGMVRCDSFMAPPKDKEWHCYDNMDECSAETETLKYGIIHYQKSPSVWDSLAR